MIVDLGTNGLARLEKIDFLFNQGFLSADTAFWLFIELIDSFTTSPDPEPEPEGERVT